MTILIIGETPMRITARKAAKITHPGAVIIETDDPKWALELLREADLVDLVLLQENWPRAS